MMNRRAFLQKAGIASATLALPYLAFGQRKTPVRLLLLRRPALSPSSECAAPCIRGQLYDVSDFPDAVLDQSLLPLMPGRPALCDVIERPWANNAPSKSAISKGVYAAHVRDDATKDWMTTLDRRWRIELDGTTPRSAIQFHYGKDVKWSEGCFILGKHLQTSDSVGITRQYCVLEDGEKAVAALRAAVMAAGRDSNKITVGVADYEGLFPDFSPNKPCPT
jgi:hypothetical protein